MKKGLLFLVLLTSLPLLRAQVQYEDFEGGTADIAWEGINGTYNGAVANPAPDAVNGSGFVGSYTNDAAFDFCFAKGTLSGGPVDLSKFNLIKMKVWSPIAPTQVLFKFEGGGSQVEHFRPIQVANQWVEISFDLSAGATFTTMDKVLVSFNPFVLGSTETFYFDDIIGLEAVEVYETFEDGGQLAWNDGQGDGEFNGPVANPDSNSVNGSDHVGQYIKSNMHGYSLLIANRDTPFDLSIFNQFHLNVHAQAPTQVLLKLEGDGGPAIEKTKNIGLTGDWQNYSFDFSDAAEYTHLTRVLIFFDPDVVMSADTYYFDNLLAIPEGACKNATLDPNMIDDFECNRNATYVNGWDSLSVVNNPSPNAINTSSKVGQYIDPSGEPWATLLIDYQNPMDLSTRHQLNVKIWSPRVVPILFKLEGGASPVKELSMDVPQAGAWVQYSIDFSGEAINSHRKIAIFFNAGEDPQAGDVYYIDDINWLERTDVVIEHFENGAFLPWEPLEQQELIHGAFAVIDNPDPSGVNTSTKVGEYTKGTSAFSTLAAVAPGVINIANRPQYNLDVWAPAAGTIRMQLESETQGNKEVTRDIETAATWQKVSFDFTEFQSISDWASLRLIFNPEIPEEGVVYYFDNLTQGQSTVDPCESVVAIDNIMDDFECQRNYETGSGASILSVAGNPKVTVANSSSYVGLYEDQPNEPWAALCYELPDGIDLSAFNQLSFQVIAPGPVPVLIKLEGGSSPVAEIWTEITTADQWETVTGDFSGQVGADHRRVCIFLNVGVTTAQVDEYYIDNVRFAHAPFDGCLINFDEPAFLSTKWTQFPTEMTGVFELQDNPDQSGVNTSLKVGKAIERPIPELNGGAKWAGMYTDLPAHIVFGGDKLVKMKVWSPQISNITIKIENSTRIPPAPNSGDVNVMNTKMNEWEELTWDFSSTPITDDGKYIRVTLIFDIDNIPSADVSYYFDDIQLSTGGCSTTSIFGGPDKPRELTVSPNPVMDLLRIDDLGHVSRLDIHNLHGQRIASVWTGTNSTALLEVSNLAQGTYVLNGYSAKGELLTVSRFVKL